MTDVSVIITSYNIARYIERAVQSALAQDGVALEVIIVDDGSADGTWEIISAITDPRVKSLRLPQNGGPSVARNTAIAAASGAWIAVLDGDDAYAPGRLARCLARAKEANADIVADNITSFREIDGKTFPMFEPARFAQYGVLTLADFIRGNLRFFGGESLGYLKPMFSAAFLKKHNLSYDPEIRIGEDYLLLAEALAEGATCAIEPTAGYLYTIRRGSISHRLIPADLERMAACDKKFTARHALSGDAAQAQKVRTAKIRDAHVYTRLIEALKRLDATAAVKLVLSHPPVLRHMWLPVMARIERLQRALSKKGAPR